MSQSHDHSHHGHSHAPKDFGRAFAIGVVLNTGFVIVEAGYGLASHSLALLADAGHNLSDVLGLLLAWGAVWASKKAPTARRSYGLRSTSILAALANAVLLLVAIGAIAWEAIGRFAHPEPVRGGVVVWVALVGIVINSVTAYLFMSGSKTDLNVRGAYLHMAADALVSLGVVFAGLAMLYTGWQWLDPVVSLVVALVIVVGTWGLFRESLNLALQAAPESVDVEAVRGFLESLPGVVAVHDMHVWAMSTTETALTVHLVIPDAGNRDAFLAETAEALHDRFGVEHTTIQIEWSEGMHPCPLAPEAVV